MASASNGPYIRLTRTMLSQSRIIAVGGRIRDVQRLVRQYGGSTPRWIKKSSPPVRIDGKMYEVHWYEHPGLGRREEKTVRSHLP